MKRAGMMYGDVMSGAATDGNKMADSPTREEMNAKLEAVEARLDAKLAHIDAKLETVMSKLESFSTKVDVSIDASREAKAAAQAAQQSSSETKWNILFTSLASLALVLAMWALWAQGVQLGQTISPQATSFSPSGVKTGSQSPQDTATEKQQ